VSELPEIDPIFGQLLDAGLGEIPLELDPDQRRAMVDHARLLLAWNAHINLSGLRAAEQIARGHVLDALIAVPALRELTASSGRSAAGAVTLLDLGSGAGYPGLPLSIALPAGRTALVDSIAKKAAFLDAAAGVVAAAVPRDIVTLAERAEDLADEPDQREGWQLVVARAVGSVAEVAELGLPLTSRDGQLVIWKRGAGSAALGQELEHARRICQAAGGTAPRVVLLDAAERVGLPGNCLVVIRKRRPTPDRYPRTTGERRRAALP